MSDHNVVKIGYTVNQRTLFKRVKSLQTGNPFKLKVETKFNGSKLKERYLHDICKVRHVSGEWFRLTKEEVKRLADKYKDWSPKDNDVEKMPDIYQTIKKNKK